MKKPATNAPVDTPEEKLRKYRWPGKTDYDPDYCPTHSEVAQYLGFGRKVYLVARAVDAGELQEFRDEHGIYRITQEQLQQYDAKPAKARGFFTQKQQKQASDPLGPCFD